MAHEGTPKACLLCFTAGDVPNCSNTNRCSFSAWLRDFLARRWGRARLNSIRRERPGAKARFAKTVAAFDWGLGPDKHRAAVQRGFVARKRRARSAGVGLGRAAPQPVGRRNVWPAARIL